MERLSEYVNRYIQRGYRGCNEGDPRAETLNFTLLMFLALAHFSAGLNLIFNPESFAFIAPILLLFVLTLEQFRYCLTMKMVGGIVVAVINVGLLYRFYTNADIFNCLTLILSSVYFISILYPLRWLFSYFGLLILAIMLFKSNAFINESFYTIMQMILTIFAVGVLTHFYNSRQNKLRYQAEKQAQDIKLFIASFSHELRSPLQSIIGFQDIIQDKVSPEYKTHVLAAQKQSQHLLRMINDILTVYKEKQNIDSLEYRPTNLVELLESEYKNTQLNIGDKPITIELSIDENTPSWVNTDSDRLHQLLQNLCSNAIKYTESGTIHISTKYSIDSTGSHCVTFIVSDTGRGLTEEQLSHLGNEFYQTDYNNPGTGLGLHICKKILHSFGSQLHIQSAFGSGSTFSFKLRFMTVCDSINDPLLTETNLSLSTCGIETVVIVDDSEINIAVLTEQLKMCNVNVISFLSGQACIDFCQKNDAFDMILMDMMMPKMDGIETARALRRMNISTPIISMSAANEQFKEEFSEVINNITLIQGELNKPFTAEQISKSLNAICQ